MITYLIVIAMIRFFCLALWCCDQSPLQLGVRKNSYCQPWIDHFIVDAMLKLSISIFSPCQAFILWLRYMSCMWKLSITLKYIINLILRRYETLVNIWIYLSVDYLCCNLVCWCMIRIEFPNFFMKLYVLIKYVLPTFIEKT